MSEEIATLGIKVDTSDVKRGADDLDKLAGAGKRAEKSTDGVSDGFRTMATAIAGLGLGATVREFIQAADAMDSMSARLKLVTTSSREAVDVQSKLVDLANANRAGLQETVSLFTKIADPVKRAGGSMADSLKIVDSFAKTLKISGASAQEAAAATYQFAQAMASGKLAGDEFRSLAEASPRFLSAMAEGMNVPREALKKLSEEGKLTIDVVGNALMKMQGQLTTEFAVLPTTVADAMTQIKNEILVGVQEINTAGGFTQGIVAGLEEVKDFMPGFKATLLEAAKGFEGLEQQTSFVEVGLTTLRYTMETLLVVGGNLAYMAQTAGRELGGMAAQMAALGRGDFAAFTAIGEAMREDAKTAKKALDDYEKRVMGAYATQDALRNDATNSRADMYKNWLRQDAEFAAQSLKIIAAYAGQSVEVQQAAMAEYVKNFYAKSAAGGGLKAPSSGGDIDKLKKDIEDLAKLLDRINGKDVGLDAGYWKDLNTLHAAYAKGKLSLDAYAKTVGNLTKQQQFSKDLISEETKAKEALVRQNEEYARSVQSALAPLEQQARMLELEVVNYGLTEAAIQSNIITRMEEARALAAANGAWPEHLNYLDQEIELRRRIATASSQKEFLDTNKRAAEQSAKEWEKFSDDINRALTDALMRGFEDGKSFGQNFVDSLKNSLKSAALKIVVNMVTSTGGSLVNAGINVLAGTSGSNGGTGTNYLGLANNASSAYNLYNTSGLAYQYLSGSMSGANALGTGYANLTNTGLDGLLATNNAFGTAATETAGASAGSSAATAGLGYFAAAAAAIMAIKYFNDRSRPLPLEFTGLAVDGQYNGKTFDGSLATNYMQGGSYWDQRMPLTSDAAIVAQNYQNLKPPVIEIANPAYADWQRAYQEAGFQNQVGSDVYLNGDERVVAPSRISGYDEGYTPAPYSTDPTVLGNIDAAIEAAFNAPKSAMKKVAELFGDSELVTKVEAFTAKISVSGQTIGEILGKIGAQVTTDLGQAFLPAVEAARVQGAALRTGLETAIANATTAGDTEAVNALKAQMEAMGIAASETWNQTFERVLKETDAVSKAMDLLGVSLKDIGDANKVLTLSDNLVTLFGSIDALNTSINAYYGNFYTEAEKQERAWKGMGDTFKTLNLALPKTREEFRALVDAQDLTTAAGQQTFAALMNVQGAFADLVPAVAAVAAETVNLKDSLTDMVAGLKTAVEDALSNVTAAYDRDVGNVNAEYEAAVKPVQAAIDAAQSLYDGIVDDVQARREAAQRELDLVLRDVAEQMKPITAQISSYSAKIAAENTRYNAEMKTLADERKAATQAYTDAIKGLPAAIDALRLTVDKVKALRNSLTGTLDGLRIQGSEAAYRTDAQAQIRNALAIARSTGNLPDAEALSSALSTVSQPSEALFATFEDYARDFYRTAIDIKDLSDIAGDQLSVTEPQLAALEAMKATLETNYAAQTAAFDAQQETLSGIHDTLIESLQAQLSTWENLKKALDDKATAAQDKFNGITTGLDEELYQAAQALKAAMAPLTVQKDDLEKDWAAELAALKATYDEALATYRDALRIDENIGTLAGNIAILATAIAAYQAGTGDKGTTTNPTPTNQWLTSPNGTQSYLDPLGASALRPTGGDASATLVSGKDGNTDTLQYLIDAANALATSGAYDKLIADAANKGIGADNVANILNNGTGTTITGADVTNWGADTVAGYAKADIKTWVLDRLTAGDRQGVYDRALAEGISSYTLDGIMGWAPGTALDWAKSNGFPAFAQGTNFVPNDMIAQIHQGERIIPAADNTLLMTMLNNGGRREEVLVEEIKALRAEVKQLREENMAAQTSIATNTRKSAQVLDEFNEIGMPGVRT